MAISLNNHESRIKALENRSSQIWLPIVSGAQDVVVCQSMSFAVPTNCTKFRVYVAGNRWENWGVINSMYPVWEGFITSGSVDFVGGYNYSIKELRLTYITTLNNMRLYSLRNITSSGDNFVFIEGLFNL